MKEKLMTLLPVLLFAVIMQAQTNTAPSYTVKGQVTDSISGETVPYATLNIVQANAPQQSVKMLACDDNGRFETTLNAPGNYVLTTRFVGKLPASKAFTIGETDRVVDLGKVMVADDVRQLNEVTVAAQKPLVKVDIDKITYSLEDDPEAKVNNTLEMLRKVPMVTVDGEDNIQLKGSTNFKIYMNGKPSNLLSNNPSEVLKSMPANSVKDIEVITDPGARYDAEGIGGIINIITQSNSALQGITGNVRAFANNWGSVNGGAYVSAKVGKLGITANFNQSQNNSPWSDSEVIIDNFMEGNEYLLTQDGRNRYKGPFQFGNLEASYEIDTLNLISVGGNIFNGRMKNISEQEVIRTNDNKTPGYSYDRNSTSENTFGSTSFNVDYQRSTSKKDELLTVSYRYSNSPNDSENRTDLDNVVDYVPETGNTYPQHSINDAATIEHTGQIDYTTPLFKGHTLETGLKYINRKSRSNTERLMFEDNKWIDISSLDSHFNHRQHIYSGYLGYAIRAGKFGYKFGARAEGTALDVAFEKAPDLNFSKDYFDFVPNATISYQLTMTQQLRLGYNMRISRPGIWYLNPYVNDTDPERISYGNPKLDTEKSHNITSNYSLFSQKFNMNASLNYSFVNNSIESYNFVDPERPGVLQTTYDNIGRTQRVGLFLYGSWNPVPLFRIYVNGGSNYVDMRSDRMKTKNSGFDGNVFAGVQLTFPQDIRLNVNGGYYAPWIQLQGEGSSFHFVGFNLSKDFLKKKLTVMVMAQNPFWETIKSESRSSAPLFNMHNINHRVSRMFALSVSYRFGSLKEQIKKVRRGISNDDEKAGGSSGSGGESGGGGQTM
ncbi:MAG: TonB-dependent receptor [Tannerellaceae bacterium]|nr:TonB-dependent receptor [Tannerellaceae bacterium]